MPEIVYYVAASLDGFIATPDGGVDWLAPFESGPEDYGYSEFYDSVDAVLLGSRTYEQSLTFGGWPYPGKPAWVFTKVERTTSQPEVHFTAQDPVDVAAEMEARGIARAWLVGGAALAGSFRSAGLITEMIVSIMPVMLGGGIPLFATPGPGASLHLLDQSFYDDGVVQLTYQVLNDG